MKNQINHLILSWSTSKGRDTYGYNICRLDDRNKGQRFRTIGGGYDMIGTVFGQWLEANYQKELIEISQRAHTVYNQQLEWVTSDRSDRLYGMTYRVIGGRITLDGACGLECMIRIAEAIGLDVERDYITKGRRRGETIGWYVQMKGE
jgi:hypothetical protein